MRTTWAITVLLFLWGVPAILLAADDMKAFPPADKGMVRYVLRLPEKEDESLFQVELIVGKLVQIDERNRYFFSGHMETEQIAGWGYTQYRVRDLGVMGGTLMAIDPNAPKVTRFITLGGGPYLIRYNSRLPVVVQVPEDAQVYYRIWSTEAESEALEKG